jgi:ankyrin repeat protein
MAVEVGELQKAVECRDLERVLHLVSEGVDASAVDETGWTPLARAAVLGDLRLIDLLLAGGADVDGGCRFSGNMGGRLLTPAQRHLRSQPDLHWVRNQGWAALLEACRMGSRTLARHLLDSGADPNRACALGGTPLMESSRLGHVGISRELLKNGAALDLRDRRGRAALHYSAGRGFVEMTELLVASGADPRLRDEKGVDALMLAARFDREVIQILLSSGANAAARGQRGDSALLRAVKAGNLGAVELLIEHGADALLRCPEAVQIRRAAERCGVAVIRQIIGSG